MVTVGPKVRLRNKVKNRKEKKRRETKAVITCPGYLVIENRRKEEKDEREVLPPNLEVTAAAVSGAASAAPHGIQIAVEFKPVEHPTEPLDNDQPIQCPFPEPSILNDGRIWKERVSSCVRRRTDLPVMQKGTPVEPEPAGTNPRPPSNRLILPSISAPEHRILKLLEESGI